MAISILSKLNAEQDITTSSNTPHNPIQGSPVKVYITLSQLEVNNISDVETFVKNKLAELLADEILKNKLCEFTKEKSAADDTIIYRARAFLTPDNQVRILRENNKL